MARHRSLRSRCRVDPDMREVSAETTDDDLDAMVEWIVDWIESIDPGFFLPEDSPRKPAILTGPAQ